MQTNKIVTKSQQPRVTRRAKESLKCTLTKPFIKIEFGI